MTQHDGNAALAKLIGVLNRNQVSYMLVGSYSSNVHGIPRATKDADLVVELLGETFEKIGGELKKDFQIDSQLQFELITGTLRRIIHYAHADFVIELFELSADPFDQLRFSRRISFQSKTLQNTVWFPTAEDVIIQKLRWGRPQDVSDASDVISVQNESLDWSYIEHWTDQHGTSEQLNNLRQSL